MDRGQQHSVTTSANHQPTIEKSDEEQVIEREHLIAQHGQAVEVLGSFVVLDRADVGLERGDVGFEGDPTLSRNRRSTRSKHDAEEPHRGPERRAQPHHAPWCVCLEHTVGRTAQPQGDQASGRRRPRS